jgi:hypothetical protein
MMRALLEALLIVTLLAGLASHGDDFCENTMDPYMCEVSR